MTLMPVFMRPSSVAAKPFGRQSVDGIEGKYYASTRTFSEGVCLFSGKGKSTVLDKYGCSVFYQEFKPDPSDLIKSNWHFPIFRIIKLIRKSLEVYCAVYRETKWGRLRLKMQVEGIRSNYFSGNYADTTGDGLSFDESTGAYKITPIESSFTFNGELDDLRCVFSNNGLQRLIDDLMNTLDGVFNVKIDKLVKEHFKSKLFPAE